MAKDPAFLFYPGDWLGGTMGMTFEQKGAYFELLIFQFNNGPFTEAQAQQVLSTCPASTWQVVRHKFSKMGDRFLNKRLAAEIEKRTSFSESRRNNAKSKKTPTKNGKAYAQHMENENRNENEDRSKDKKEPKIDLNDYEKWTRSIEDNADPTWEPMFMNSGIRIPPGKYLGLVQSHLQLLARYPNMRPQSQQAFRHSLLKHISENKDKEVVNGTVSKNGHGGLDAARTDFARRASAQPAGEKI